MKLINGECLEVMNKLIDEGIKVDEYICSDINEDLINLWTEIKNNPEKINR